MRNITLLSFVIVALALGACQMNEWGRKQTIGTGAGALAGGLLGSQVGDGSGRLWATGAGVLLGALVGSEIGLSLDKADMAYAREANQSAYTAPIGEPVRWNNPENGHSGVVTATRDGYSQISGNYCGEYEQKIYIDGREETGYGVACRQPDGRWEVVD